MSDSSSGGEEDVLRLAPQFGEADGTHIQVALLGDSGVGELNSAISFALKLGNRSSELLG